MVAVSLTNSLSIVQGRFCHQVTYEKPRGAQRCVDFRIAERAEALCCPLAMGGHVTARGRIWKEMSQTVDVWGVGSMAAGT